MPDEISLLERLIHLGMHDIKTLRSSAAVVNARAFIARLLPSCWQRLRFLLDAPQVLAQLVQAIVHDLGFQARSEQARPQPSSRAWLRLLMQ